MAVTYDPSIVPPVGSTASVPVQTAFPPTLQISNTSFQLFNVYGNLSRISPDSPYFVSGYNLLTLFGGSIGTQFEAGILVNDQGGAYSGSAPFGGYFYANSITGQSMNARYATYTNAPVPEPAAWAMMIIGLGVIGGALRRRRVSGSTAIRFDKSHIQRGRGTSIT